MYKDEIKKYKIKTDYKIKKNSNDQNNGDHI
jgi:hypothetical protein